MPDLTWDEYRVWAAPAGPSAYRFQPCAKCNQEVEADEMDRHVVGCMASFRWEPSDEYTRRYYRERD